MLINVKINPICLISLYILVIFSRNGINCLENGLARTPPMGWLSWERFRCQTDCKKYPNDCINEHLIKSMADRMAADGYSKAGYEYVIIDDCWLAKERGKDGNLRADPLRFPSGIKALADYVHSKGLKFGIYEDIGPLTCAGYPGSEHHLQMDTALMAAWGVDYLKFDACYYPPEQYKFGYPPMAFYLNMTGRPILFSCEYPLYQRAVATPNYTLVAAASNLARNYDDIDDSWDSVVDVMAFYAKNEGAFAESAKPGFFNDPDMLVVGNFGLSPDQERVQMAMWCVLAAPLLMSADLRNIRNYSKDVMLNSMAISVNQDALGAQGKRVNVIGKVEIWMKPIKPKGSYAITFVNLNNATPQLVTVTLESAAKLHNYWGEKIETESESLNIKKPKDPKVLKGYNMTEVFDKKYEGFFEAKQGFSMMVNPNGVYFAVAIAVYA